MLLLSVTVLPVNNYASRIANSMASNRGRIFASNVPNYAYTYASANMNNMGLPSKIGGGLFDAGVGNR